MKKIVVKLNIFDEKEKTKAYQTVSSLSGIESISIDMKERKLTVIGDVDPIEVVNKLRKLWHTELISFGPDEEPEKKLLHGKNKEVMKAYDKMKEVMKKDGENKAIIQEIVTTYQSLLEMYMHILGLYSQYSE